MSKNEFDELLLKKLREADFEYDPASWEKLAQKLPSATPSGADTFDGLLVKKLQEEELEYKAGGWEQLAAMLPPVPVAESPAFAPNNNRKRWALAAGIAAALVLVMGTAVFLKQANNDTLDKADDRGIAGTQQPVKKNTGASQQNTGKAVSTPVNPATVSQQANPVAQSSGNNIPQQNKPTIQAPQNGPFHNTVNPFTHPAIQQQQVQQVAQNEIAPKPIPVVETPAPAEQPKMIATPAIENRVPAETYAYSGNNEVSAFYEGKGTPKNAKTSISLGGGVNYGNLNTGYTAGVTVRRKIAGDFFVDGTVAMMYNNNASNVAVNNGPSLNNTAARPASFNETPLSSPALDPIQKLYYVQFNPSIGYQVERHVALSVGGDFQQMLNKQEEIVQPESNNSRLFPNFDVGLTTKSEFSITPNIQAGLMYREGLNNLFKNDGSKYVNRRYVQVQFKYNIPVN